MKPRDIHFCFLSGNSCSFVYSNYNILSELLNCSIWQWSTDNMVLSVQLLGCLRVIELDRWIPFPVHWLIVSWTSLCDVIVCVCVCVYKNHKARDFAHQRVPPTPAPFRLHLSVPLSIKNTGSKDSQHLTQACSVADLISVQLKFPLICQPRCVNSQPLSMNGLCASVYSIS